MLCNALVLHLCLHVCQGTLWFGKGFVLCVVTSLAHASPLGEPVIFSAFDGACTGGGGGVTGGAIRSLILWCPALVHFPNVSGGC